MGELKEHPHVFLHILHFLFLFLLKLFSFTGSFSSFEPFPLLSPSGIKVPQLKEKTVEPYLISLYWDEVFVTAGVR